MWFGRALSAALASGELAFDDLHQLHDIRQTGDLTG
jgi:hypothetical protein